MMLHRGFSSCKLRHSCVVACGLQEKQLLTKCVVVLLVPFVCSPDPPCVVESAVEIKIDDAILGLYELQIVAQL